MQLPYTSNSLLAWIDTSEKYVLRDSSNNLVSVVERLSGIPLTSDTGAAPTWADNQVNGRPALTFAGAQNLRFNFNKDAASVGTKNPIALMAVAQCTTYTANLGLGSPLFHLGSSTLANTYLLAYFLASGGNKIQTARGDDAGNGDAGGFVLSDTSFHVFTVIYDGTRLKLRIDGVEKNNVAAPLTTGHFDGNQLSIGDFTTGGVGGFGHDYFIGKVATALVYEGLNGDIDLSPETWLKQLYGL